MSKYVFEACDYTSVFCRRRVITLYSRKEMRMFMVEDMNGKLCVYIVWKEGYFV